MKRYTIKFESRHRQWVVIDAQDPDANLGYHYNKSGARTVAVMLNQRIELLAVAERLQAWRNGGGTRSTKQQILTGLINDTITAIAKIKGGA